MAHVRTLPRIVWDGNTINFPYPLDGTMTWTLPRGVDLRFRGVANTESYWDDGLYDYYLAFDIRWVKKNAAFDLGPNPPGGYGFDDMIKPFLEWAWEGGVFTFYPDQDNLAVSYQCWLEKPEDGSAISTESDGTRRVTMTIRSNTEIIGY